MFVFIGVFGVATVNAFAAAAVRLNWGWVSHPTRLPADTRGARPLQSSFHPVLGEIGRKVSRQSGTLFCRKFFCREPWPVCLPLAAGSFDDRKILGAEKWRRFRAAIRSPKVRPPIPIIPLPSPLPAAFCQGSGDEGVTMSEGRTDDSMAAAPPRQRLP